MFVCWIFIAHASRARNNEESGRRSFKMGRFDEVPNNAANIYAGTARNPLR